MASQDSGDASSSSSSSSSSLTLEQVETFNRDGYLIIPDALSRSTVDALLAETHRLLGELDIASHPMTRFRTGGEDGRDHVGDDYFLSSGDKIHYFFEEDAFTTPSNSDDPDAKPALSKPVHLAVNKIGHYLHHLSPPFASLLSPTSQSPTPSGIARSLGFKSPRCLQSMIILKQREIGGAVPPHQDSTFLYTDPPSAVGFWYALEDATLENGCLSFLPGSHRWAPITRRLIRGGEGGTEMVDNLSGRKFPAGAEGYGLESDSTDDKKEEDWAPGEVKAGSLVLIHGNLLHKSEKNTSPKGRIIYTFHIIEGADGWTYDDKNWLQRPEEGFTRIYT